MIRIITAAEPKLITITVDGELAGEYVDAGRDVCEAGAGAAKSDCALFARGIPHRREGARSFGPPRSQGCPVAGRRSLFFVRRGENQQSGCLADEQPTAGDLGCPAVVRQSSSRPVIEPIESIALAGA